MLGYAAGALFGGNGDWRAVYESVIPFELMMLAGAFVVPESSRWLALRGRSADAAVALKQAQGITEDEVNRSQLFACV